MEETVVEDKNKHELARSTEEEASFFSELTFNDLCIRQELKNAVMELGFEKLTEIQAKAIPKLLKGKDVLAAAKTGSGKTLTFLIPTLNLLIEKNFQPLQGTGAIILSPTRELSMQTYDVCVDIGKYVSLTFGLVMGGANRKMEVEKLAKGVAVVVATPGRLLDHLQNTKAFTVTNLLSLVIDEADRILAIGFEEEVNEILRLLPSPPQRRTSLFSATQTSKVADLARLSLTKPVLVRASAAFSTSANCLSSSASSSSPTVSGLKQGYVVCPGQQRFLLLFTFLKKNRNKKVMVFFSSCMSVRFHEELLSYVDFEVRGIHGKKKQTARMSIFYEFCNAESGVLLCTDVAARGLDIPNVDWIVQYDPPDDPAEYIHRVGRTARGFDGVGKALLFLMPEEVGFLQYLMKTGVKLNEFVFSAGKVANVQPQLERLIEKNYHLHRSSRDAYRSYLHAYASHSLKEIFDVGNLDLQSVAKGFGFSAPPKVELNLKHKQTKQSRRPKTLFGKPSSSSSFSSMARKKVQRQSSVSAGRVFSASNPYGRRNPKDQRQFAM